MTPSRYLPLIASTTLLIACAKPSEKPAPAAIPTVREVPAASMPTALPKEDASAVLARALTALPQVPSPSPQARETEQTFPLPQPSQAPAPLAAQKRVEPTPRTVNEELERCVTYLAVDDQVHRAVMLPEHVPLLVTARNSCDTPFPPDDSWFEVRAVDRSGHVLARATGRFPTALPARGTAESAITLYPVEDRVRLQVTYQVKPWWAAGGGRRVGE